MDFVLRFSTSPERCKILDGLLRYRDALRCSGVESGYQWVNGSFVEHVEVLANRAPNDVDVVTFFSLPAGVTQQDIFNSNPELFRQAKKKYFVDSYFVELTNSEPDLLVRETSYWYSMWSHRRDRRWKGFVKIHLDHTGDAAARKNLDAVSTTEVCP